MEQEVNKFELRFNNKVYYTDKNYYLKLKSNQPNTWITFKRDNILMCRDLQEPLELYGEFTGESYICENKKTIEFNTCVHGNCKIIYNVEEVTYEYFNLIVKIFFDDKLIDKFNIPFMTMSRRDFEYDIQIEESVRIMEELERKRNEMQKILLHFFNKKKVDVLEVAEYTLYRMDIEEWCTFTSSLIAEDENGIHRYLKFSELKYIVEELKNE